MIFNLFPPTEELAMLEPDRNAAIAAEFAKQWSANAERLASNLETQAAKGLRFTPHPIEDFRQRKMLAASNAIWGSYDFSLRHFLRSLWRSI